MSLTASQGLSLGLFVLSIFLINLGISLIRKSRDQKDSVEVTMTVSAKPLQDLGMVIEYLAKVEITAEGVGAVRNTLLYIGADAPSEGKDKVWGETKIEIGDLWAGQTIEQSTRIKIPKGKPMIFVGQLKADNLPHVLVVETKQMVSGA